MSNSEITKPFFDRQSFSPDSCFLCGNNLSSKQTKEHVFPKWIQQEFRLSTQKLLLPNKTPILYNQLTISCCNNCNNVHLSQLEKDIKKAFSDGFSGLTSIEPLRIFQWVAKIYYGIMFKELFLKSDRANPNSEKIRNPDLLKEIDFIHTFLQTINGKTKLITQAPFSLFIFEIAYADELYPFDYWDYPKWGVCALRYKNLAIIVCFFDRALVYQGYKSTFENLQKINIHPIQYYEFLARVSYRAALVNAPETFIAISQNDETAENLLITPPLTGDFNSYHRPENPALLVELLAVHLNKFGMTKDELQNSNGEIWTSILDEDDCVKEIDKEGNLIRLIC